MVSYKDTILGAERLLASVYTMAKTVIELEDVWKVYRMGEVDVVALKSASLEIKQGEFAVVEGPSGSGKSTMLNLIGCLDLPSHGKVILDGENISHMRESKLSQTRGRKMGFVFQQFNLMPSLNALDNIMLPMQFLNIDPRDAREKALDALEMVGLSNRALHLPSQMSGGERQRVAIARAISCDPEIIIADEPTGNLDSKTGTGVVEFLMRLHKQGKTIVMATHDPDFMSLAERIIHIKDAQIERIEHNHDSKKR
jgi:putative ABC transport system ATP-binding protein